MSIPYLFGGDGQLSSPVLRTWLFCVGPSVCVVAFFTALDLINRDNPHHFNNANDHQPPVTTLFNKAAQYIELWDSHQLT